MTDKPAVKAIFLSKRKSGITPEEFKNYYEDNHTRLVLKTLPFLSKYVRNYITGTLDLRGHDEAEDCDVITEGWFDTREDFENWLAEAQKPEVTALLKSDEVRFLDMDNIKAFIVEECQSDIQKSG